MKSRALILALMSTVAWTIPAGAQTAPADAKTADTTTTPPAAQPPESSADIVVTALKQNQTALKVPATISILPAESLSSKNITSANQLNSVVPGLTMSLGVAGLPGTSFRGLGSNSAVFGLEPSVAEYIDGAYMPHVRDYVAPLFDVDHIEFIKGTQSTLLGKNTSLGAISIVNKRPTKEFGYFVQLTHSFRIDGNKLDAAVNVPLGDDFQARVAVLAAEDQGYFDNIYLNRSEARTQNLSGRLSLAWQPVNGLDMTLIYQHDRRRVRGQNLELVFDPTNTVANRAIAVGVPFSAAAPNLTTNASAGLGGTPAALAPFDNQDTNRVNFILNYDLGGLTLTSQTVYSQWGSKRSTDLDFTAANLFNLDDSERSRVFTQELRLASPSGGRLTYLFGLYYYHNNWLYDRAFIGQTNTAGFPLTGAARSTTILPTTAYSAFGSMSFEIVKGLKIEGGLRYTHEKKEGSFVRNSTGALNGAFPTTPFTVYAPQTTEPLDYNVGLSYSANSSVLFYASYSKGSKSGGFQDAPTTVAGAPFAPETAFSAEGGVKVRLQGSSYITAAVFDTRVRNFQTSYTALAGTPPVSQTVVGNSQTRSTGAEINASFGLVPGLKIGGNLVYANSRFTDVFPATAAIGRKGDTLTRAPKWSGSADINYVGNVSPSLKAFTSVSLSYTSKTLYQFVVPQPTAPFGAEHALVDATLGVRSNDGRWQVSLLGTNLFNKRYVDFATGVSAGGGAYYGSWNRPRVIALQLTLKN